MCLMMSCINDRASWKDKVDIEKVVMKQYQGYFFGLLAACFNGLIGVFSVKIMEQGFTPFAVAFYKCFIGFMILTTWLILSGQFIAWLTYMKSRWWQLALASFFVFFVLNIFETTAFKYENVTIVACMMLGSAVITTFILSAIFDKRWLAVHEMISIFLALAGLGLVFGISMALCESFLGIMLALLGGLGYGTFLTISPRLNIGSGFIVVNGLLLFGSVFLLMPFAYDGLVLIAHQKRSFYYSYWRCCPLSAVSGVSLKHYLYCQVKQFNYWI